MVYVSDDVSIAAFNYILWIGVIVGGLLCVRWTRLKCPTTPADKFREDIRISISLLGTVPIVFAAVMINQRLWDYAGIPFPPNISNPLESSGQLILLLLLGIVPFSYFLLRRLAFKLLPVKPEEKPEEHLIDP